MFSALSPQSDHVFHAITSNRKETACQHAILVVTNEKLSIMAAIQKTNDDLGFKVDKSILWRKLNVNQNPKTAKPGCPPVLNPEQ